MTQEEKQLLLADLSARLPYGTMVKCNTDYRHEFDEELSVIHIMNFCQFEVKPFLRPMSSMTEEERKEYEGFIIHRDHVNAWGQEWDIDCFSFDNSPRLIDWLNAHHFDYRGLIKKGLAIKVTKENNPYKE